MRMKIVAIYMRVSGPGQRDRHTIEVQRELLQRYCREHDYEVIEYCDDGVSSTKLNFDKRPAGRRLIADAEAGKFDMLLICDWDRLARQNADYHTTLAFLDGDLEVTVESITQPHDATTPDGRYYRAMAGAE